MEGHLLVDKPKGWTSFDVVNKIRHTIQDSGLNTTGKKRFPVGHTGTLDPLATGLLVILLGGYTKRASELIKLDKTYEVTIKLGETSTTGDEEGDKIHVSNEVPTEESLRAVIRSFEGEIEQIPPAFSAIKVNGKRSYELARKGKEVKLEPRQVTIYQISDVKYEYPEVTFTAKVSSGTYVRSLVQDIGEALSTGAYMSDLRRTQVGDFRIEDAITSNDISGNTIYSNMKILD